MSEQKKILTLMWARTNPMEMGKDVVLVPYYLGRALGYQTKILCGYDDAMEECIRQSEREDLTFVRRNLTFKVRQRIPVYVRYLWKHAREIDLLMRFHWRFETWMVILLYRLFGGRGKVYVKLDTSIGIGEWDLYMRGRFDGFFRRRIYNLCIKMVDVFSCETAFAYQNISENKDFGAMLKPKLVLMFNAFDEDLLNKLRIEERDYSRKENLMITVGRLGTHQKNTEMLLRALESVDLKGWKFCAIGPIENGFRPMIEDFYKRNPEKRNSVRFLGPVYDKKQLWEYYNKAKVFVLTSRWESSGIVLIEAKRFRNYILSTQVGEAEYLIGKETFGTFIEQENDAQLSEALNRIVEGTLPIDVYQHYDPSELSYQSRIQVVAEKIKNSNSSNSK